MPKNLVFGQAGGGYHALVSGLIRVTSGLTQRSVQIRSMLNIRNFDSLHLACAELGVDVLLTTDMKFLKGSQRTGLKIAVKNPVEFVMEVFGQDESDNENS